MMFGKYLNVLELIDGRKIPNLRLTCPIGHWDCRLDELEQYLPVFNKGIAKPVASTTIKCPKCGSEQLILVMPPSMADWKV